ncbi:hypothetical protein [Nocardia thailandica]|nr:hypothetical protein [Nocardia thailandica]
MTDHLVLDVLATRGEPGSDWPVWLITGLALACFWGFVGWALRYAKDR